jgi:RNase P subunit RPR2
MPAFIQHHDIEHHAQMAPVICPNCMGPLPMYVREVEPRWSLAEIDFVYECCDCGNEVRQTVRKADARH